MKGEEVVSWTWTDSCTPPPPGLLPGSDHLQGTSENGSGNSSGNGDRYEFDGRDFSPMLSHEPELDADALCMSRALVFFSCVFLVSLG